MKDAVKMVTVYVNLHKSYDYSNIVISTGYIEQLKDYVKYVDWLEWDYASLKRKPLIRCMGGFLDDVKAVEKHIIRTYIFLQRLIDCTDNIKIFIRDVRSDDWACYIQSEVYFEEQMYKEEIELLSENSRIRWLKDDLEKYTQMKNGGTKESFVFWDNMVSEKREELNELLQEEVAR